MTDILKRIEQKLSGLDYELNGDLAQVLCDAFDEIEAKDKRIAELEVKVAAIIRLFEDYDVHIAALEAELEAKQ